MARTVSRTRLLRGTQSARTREVVAGDAVAPRRRRLSANGPTRPNRPSDPGEFRNRLLQGAGDPDRAAMQRQSGARSRSRLANPVAPSLPKRKRTRAAAVGAGKPDRDGAAASLENTDDRSPSRGGQAVRERHKIFRGRDGPNRRARIIV